LQYQKKSDKINLSKTKNKRSKNKFLYRELKFGGIKQEKILKVAWELVRITRISICVKKRSKIKGGTVHLMHPLV